MQFSKRLNTLMSSLERKLNKIKRKMKRVRYLGKTKTTIYMMKMLKVLSLL